MTELIVHAQHYDRKDVVVMGTVHAVHPASDKQGKAGFQFLLESGTGTLKVFSRLPVQEGAQLVIEGTFVRRRQSGRMPVYNEVTATFIQPVEQLNPDLVG